MTYIYEKLLFFFFSTKKRKELSSDFSSLYVSVYTIFAEDAKNYVIDFIVQLFLHKFALNIVI